MEQTEQTRIRLTEFDKLLFKTMRIRSLTGLNGPVIEDIDSPKFFIKFMSDHGKRDETQGTLFRLLLKVHGIAHETISERAFHVQTAQFRKSFPILWQLLIEEAK